MENRIANTLYLELLVEKKEAGENSLSCGERRLYAGMWGKGGRKGEDKNGSKILHQQ